MAHAYVIDGYRPMGLYHVNWGWGGISDGYFRLSALNPEQQGIGGGSGGYSLSQEMVIAVPEGEEVAEVFDREFTQGGTVCRRKGEKPHVDLLKAIEITLKEVGIKPENISISDAGCSRCNPARYFSARHLGVSSGRTLTVIMQK